MLGGLSVPVDDRVLVDYRTSDDAGVYKLDEDRALVQTVDFFTPIVDDPFTYGRIAAANALSDVYAMGGRPLTALAVAGFPASLDSSVLGTIFAGGLEMLRQAGVALLGGHTVQDQEIKFGYAITGEVHPARIWSNAGARAGDVLFLTKPLGTGIIATALKAGRAPEPAVAASTEIMLTLNRGASEVLKALPQGAVHACTDVTGFGLVGHGCEMAAASGVTLDIVGASVPLIEGVLTLAAGNVPGGGRTNARHFASAVSFSPGIDADLLAIFHDPQTSGGLLVAVDEAHADAARSGLLASGAGVHLIGRVVPAGESRLRFR
ncbi:selenide, water dikinase SelD [soil metagenome]